MIRSNNLFFLLYCVIFTASINVVQGQTYILNINNIKAVLFIDSFDNNDSIIYANIAITNNSSKKVYIPFQKMDTLDFSLNYHFFYRNHRLYYLFGNTESFLGVMNLGMWIVVEEFLPQQRKILPIKIIKKDLTNLREIKEICKSDIYDIVFLFEYIPKKKKVRKFDDELMIEGVDYWKQCIRERSTFKYLTPR